MERRKNIGLAFFLMSFMSISSGIGLKDVVQNSLFTSIIIALFFGSIGTYLYLKKT